ncbi:uncharacterized protein VTP21DRAFT_1543 [Calcarisporiella thermophila]|uniref:uncharacterized protein n=1 Tax=Calcarisporiella thermophila TaxID=911321 RepID=UPI003743DFD6
MPILGFIPGPNLKPRQRIIHVHNRALRKCCGCIHLRAGGLVTCLIWLGFSIWFATLAFMGISPFYSYLNPTALNFFGAVCIAFAFVCLFGFLTIFIAHAKLVRTFSHLSWTMVAIFTLDNLINIGIFADRKREYISWCMGVSSRNFDNIQAQLANGTTIAISFNTQTDIFNCNRMFGDELKFGLLSFFIFMLLYFYWAACIWSYSHKRQLWFLHELATAVPPPPPPPPANPPAPAPAAAAAAATVPPPAPAVPPPGQPAAIQIQLPPMGMGGMMPGMMPQPGFAPGMPFMMHKVSKKQSGHKRRFSFSGVRLNQLGEVVETHGKGEKRENKRASAPPGTLKDEDEEELIGLNMVEIPKKAALKEKKVRFLKGMETRSY